MYDTLSGNDASCAIAAAGKARISGSAVKQMLIDRTANEGSARSE